MVAHERLWYFKNEKEAIGVASGKLPRKAADNFGVAFVDMSSVSSGRSCPIVQRFWDAGKDTDPAGFWTIASESRNKEFNFKVTPFASDVKSMFENNFYAKGSS